MSISFEINAEVRNDMGKGASRRLRRDNKVPAIIYGGGKDPVTLSIDHDKIMHSLDNEAFYSHILTVKVNGKAEKAVLKNLHRHPYKRSIMHLDLQRVSMTEKLRMNVPVHFLGEDVAPGVKQEGGVISHLLNDVEITCLPKDLPEYLEVDVSNLQLNESLHLSDIKIPEGVEIIELTHGEKHDQPLVSIHMPRAVVEPEPETVAAEGAEGEAAAESEEAAAEGEDKKDEDKSS